MLEEAKKRDHKKLGREMGLFMMSEYAPVSYTHLDVYKRQNVLKLRRHQKREKYQ